MSDAILASHTKVMNRLIPDFGQLGALLQHVHQLLGMLLCHGSTLLLLLCVR